jgi:CheY-like chemotaxis protein/anti-sigma regulatory factor (Ser/Thr protein kinase)
MKGVATGKFIDIIDITPIILAKFEAERNAEAKSLFLANTSHEIRTPMNAILGMTELILRNELPPNIREDALTIRRSASNLLSIINDVLDFSKIESGKMEIVPAAYEPASLLHDVINIVRMRITEDDVLFTVNIDSKLPRVLIGDEARLRQIFINLLSNAVKYTKKGHIYLEVSIGRHFFDEDIQLNFTVVDTGIGIREEDMDRLFNDFIRLDTQKNSNVIGTGLGLVISRNLCRMMDGDISVFSQYGKGSVFTATVRQKVKDKLPLAVVDAPETKAVLLYEPNSLCARSVARSLDNLGVRRTIVSKRDEFEAALQRECYPFVFMNSKLYESASGLLRTFAPQSVQVLLSEFDETIRPNIRVIALPAYALSIANVLNNTVAADTDTRDAEEKITRFIAPEARMLIVDDNATNLKVAEGLLSPYGLQTDTCMSGAAALQLVQTRKYDLIFMDHMMPEMDGVEAVARIRAIDGDYFKTLPIIALTANAISGTREILLQSGFDDYLAKPIEIQKLNGIMDRWVPKEKRA